jgi:hypothetical protein
MCDKIFGTYSDTTTQKQQFESCSYGDFTITNDYRFDLSDTVEKAPLQSIHVRPDACVDNTSVGDRRYCAEYFDGQQFLESNTTRFGIGTSRQ